MTDTSFEQAHAQWHEQVEARRTAPYGPLSATALHWLSTEPQSFPEVPGTWSATEDGLVTVVFDGDLGVRQNGRRLEGATAIGPLSGIQSTTLEWNGIHLELAARSGSIVLRPRDPRSPEREHYEGTATFPPDPRWVIRGRFLAHRRNAVEVDTVVAGAQQHYDSPGVAEVKIGDRTVRLTLFPGSDTHHLRALFADATGTDLTFPAARSVEVLREDEAVLIDFNRATNPPCAYSPAATCPFPPPENRLDVRIEAGELRPGIRL